MSEEDYEDDYLLEHYMSIGAIDVAGIDESGEFIMEITEKAKEVAPELWESHERHVNDSLMKLYDLGLMTVTYNEDLEAVFELTEEGKQKAREFGIVQIDSENLPND
jgi:hypothetical protein